MEDVTQKMDTIC